AVCSRGMSDEINIQFTRFSAFYSPLIATIAGGFLAEEGLTSRHSVAPAGRSAIEGLLDGSVHVCHRRGLGYAAIKAVDVPSGQMDAAFRAGQGDYIHQQGPAPQQLEHDGA